MSKNEILAYKGYCGTVNWSLTDNVFFGKVINVKSTITFEGKTISELEKDFKDAIDDYLELCKAHDEIPEKPKRALQK